MFSDHVIRKRLQGVNAKEQAQLQKAQDYAAKRKEFTIMQMNRYHDLMPEAGYYFESLFLKASWII